MYNSALISASTTFDTYPEQPIWHRKSGQGAMTMTTMTVMGSSPWRAQVPACDKKL
jgi:hypothetical protein